MKKNCKHSASSDWDSAFDECSGKPIANIYRLNAYDLNIESIAIDRQGLLAIYFRLI